MSQLGMILSVQNLSKSFAGRLLFSGVSFGIDEGDRIGLVGPNGAGKSTLLKILAQELKSDEGTVVSKRGLKIGYLPQNPSFQKGETIFSALLKKSKDPDHDFAKAYEWMAKLELSKFGEDFLATDLSGGWQKRLALGAELLVEPDLLLLDEPTNHLDVHQILWLENYLSEAPFALLTITHDRLFLQRVSNQIMDLDPKNPDFLFSMKGEYADYLENKESLLAAQQEKEKVLKNTYRRELEWLRRGAQARQTKQKARIERTGDLKENVSETIERNRNQKAGIHFGDLGRSPKKLLEITDLKIQYGEKVLFENFSFLVTPQTRLALLGDNGVGKSSLIRAIMGEEVPKEGKINKADGLQIAYFEQNRQTLDPQKSLLRNLVSDGDYVDCRGEYIFAKSYLERFLFKPQQMDVPVKQLSGGEQSRLRIAQLMLQKAQVLILDEPTNDLDVQTLTVLEEALNNFNGAVILVTHDRFFMDQVAQDILSFTPDNNGLSRLDLFKGYLQWENWDREFQKNKDQKQSKVIKNMEFSSGTDVSMPSSDSVKSIRLSNKEKYELENIESNIQKQEAELEKLKSDLADPLMSTQVQKVIELSEKISKNQTQLDQMYERWAFLEKRQKGEL
ncbi:MAG TPA: ABC-F family ATP-binding cassette domain-containing protein [Pseudobdellovibrionaceae bacterium]|nr:ABC-F family ATP-binding cassette domain-containing protein [Pseudobdellovibrionaceae bacterium]